jgi:hypothetical protein
MRTIAASAGKQPRNHVQNRTCLQRRAGVRARYKNSGYGQPKGGRKGGLFPSIIINTLIYNIFMMDCGAPTRTRTADLLITNQLPIKTHTTVQLESHLPIRAIKLFLLMKQSVWDIHESQFELQSPPMARCYFCIFGHLNSQPHTWIAIHFFWHYVETENWLTPTEEKVETG